MTKSAQRANGRAAGKQRAAEPTEPDIKVKTWGEIKAMIESQGVTDDDLIFMVDLGPAPEKVFVSRDYVGQVEISDGPPPSAAPERG